MWSPDGKRIAFTSARDGNKEIYLMNADGSEQTRLAAHPANDESPRWLADGRILFTSARNGKGDIYVMNGDGGNVTRLTTKTAMQPAASSDGKRSHSSARVSKKLASIFSCRYSLWMLMETA